MRINLVTPFAEKDAVKALGARWDAAKKCWYIVDIEDLTPFARWIPNVAAAVDVADGTQQVKKPIFNLPPVVGALAPSSAPVKADTGKVGCGCDVLPWDDCVHTAKG